MPSVKKITGEELRENIKRRISGGMLRKMNALPNKPAGWIMGFKVEGKTDVEMMLRPKLFVGIPKSVRKGTWRDAYGWIVNCQRILAEEYTDRRIDLEAFILYDHSKTWEQRAAAWKTATGERFNPDTLRRRFARRRALWRKENPIDKIEYVAGGKTYPVEELECTKEGPVFPRWAESVVTEPPAGGQFVIHPRRKNRLG